MDEWIKETLDETVDEKGQSADSTQYKLLISSWEINWVTLFHASMFLTSFLIMPSNEFKSLDGIRVCLIIMHMS